MIRRSTGIRMKLIGIIIPIVLIIIISYFALSRNMVLEEARENLQAKAQVHAGQISAWTTQIFAELTVYKDGIESGVFADDDEILEYMLTSYERSESYPVGLYMGDDSGVYLDASGWVPGDDWVLTERDWYRDGKGKSAFIFGEPYYDSMTGQMCISASVQVDYPDAVRVLATDVYLDYVSELIASIADRGEVETFLVTKDSGTIIAHPDTEMVAVTLETDGMDPFYHNVGQILAQDANVVRTIQGEHGKYSVCLNPIDNTDWYLVTYISESQMLSRLHMMEIIMAILAVVATLVLIFAILRVMSRVLKPVEKMTEVIDRIAGGDFSEDLEIKGHDEIARMSKNMQIFITKMRSTISEIRHTAEWLNRQSLENDQVSESLKSSAQTQYQAMEVLSDMVEQLSNSVEEVSLRMDKLAELTELSHAEGTNADGLMKESVVMSKSGREDMERISRGMEDINDSITTLSEQMDRMGKATAQIGDMVNMIIDIAEETNLLSLNASIEAARAGDAGKGFAIVAEQIGKLAASSSVAADDISRLTAQIRETVHSAETHMTSSVSKVKENVKIVTGARTTFEGLYEKVDETSRRVEEMIALVGRVDAVMGQLEKITAGQVQAAEQIAESAQELGLHTKNVTDGSNHVADTAETLKKESMELTDRLSQFKV